jgi:hypothetical protein
MSAADRYALVTVADGGLLLDLESGGLFELNRTAAFIWERFLDGLDADAIASKIAQRHGIDAVRARADVAGALTPGDPPEPPPLEEYQFHRTTSGYMQLYRERPELEIDVTGAELAVVAPVSERRPRRLRNSLQAVVPKIMSLRGHTVLHASAVLAQGRLLAFSGHSGAGKTTTARALVDRGATLVSEDKLLVHAEAGSALAWRNAELSIAGWVTHAVTSLLADGRVSCSPLDEAARGEQLPIAEFGFLDVVQREGDHIRARRLDVREGATAMFRGMFLGTELATRWRRHLATAGALAERVPSYALTMPNGLAALALEAGALERRGTLAV